jgi:hypothetical protein
MSLRALLLLDICFACYLFLRRPLLEQGARG